MTITDEIKLIKNTIEMLQNTYNDMIDRNAHKSEVALVLETIHEKQDILNGLYEKLRKTSNPAQEDGLWGKYTTPNQTYYTNYKSDSFDEEKIKEYLNKCDMEKDYSRYNQKPAYDALKAYNNLQFHMKDEDIHDEISKRDWVKSNMFLIRWPDQNTPVREYDFIGFYENSNEKTIFITAKDFTSKRREGTFVFSKYLKDVSKPGPIKVQYLNGYGELMYGEEYSGCEIQEVNRTPMSYDSDGVVEIEFKVVYESKRFYDTTAKKEN